MKQVFDILRTAIGGDSKADPASQRLSGGIISPVLRKRFPDLAAVTAFQTACSKLEDDAQPSTLSWQAARKALRLIQAEVYPRLQFDDRQRQAKKAHFEHLALAQEALTNAEDAQQRAEAALADARLKHARRAAALSAHEASRVGIGGDHARLLAEASEDLRAAVEREDEGEQEAISQRLQVLYRNELDIQAQHAAANAKLQALEDERANAEAMMESAEGALALAGRAAQQAGDQVAAVHRDAATTRDLLESMVPAVMRLAATRHPGDVSPLNRCMQEQRCALDWRRVPFASVNGGDVAVVFNVQAAVWPVARWHLSPITEEDMAPLFEVDKILLQQSRAA